MITSAGAPVARVRIYLGVGANLGDAAATLAWAVGALDGLPGAHLRGVSRLYATAPWGVVDQPEFRNAVVALDLTTPRDRRPADAALDLLARLKEVERAAGRRPGTRWGPRELDVDLLVFGRHRIQVARGPDARSLDAEIDPSKAARRLEVPHRDAGERLFVLAPLADVAPGLVPPGWHVSVETRRRQVAATEATEAVRVVGTWDPGRANWVEAVSSGWSPSVRARPRARRCGHPGT